MKLLDIIKVDFEVTGQLQVRYSVFVRYWRKNGNIMGQHELFIDFEAAYESVGGEVF
jgi:hypothetical protein